MPILSRPVMFLHPRRHTLNNSGPNELGPKRVIRLKEVNILGGESQLGKSLVTIVKVKYLCLPTDGSDGCRVCKF